MKSVMSEALDRLKREQNEQNLGLDVNNLIVINEYCSSVYDKMNEK